MGGSKVEAPAARDYGRETRDTLQAQVDLAPQLYESEAQYRPLYSQLDARLLREALMGTPAGTRTSERQVTDFSPSGWYDTEGSMVSTDPNWKPPETRSGQTGLWGAPGGAVTPLRYEWRNGNATPRTITETTTTPGAPGIVDIYGELIPRLGEIESADQARKLTSELGLVREYGPQVIRGLREAAGNAKLIDLLNRQAEDELGMGATLDPSLRREVAQGVRSAQAARGMGTGPADVQEEALYTGLQAEQLRRARQGFAMQVAGMDQATAADPFMALLGRSSGAWNAAQGYGQQGQSLTQGGARLFNPESSYAQDIWNTNYNAEAASRIATANNRTAITGGIISAVGSVVGGAVMA